MSNTIGALLKHFGYIDHEEKTRSLDDVSFVGLNKALPHPLTDIDTHSSL